MHALQTRASQGDWYRCDENGNNCYLAESTFIGLEYDCTDVYPNGEGTSSDNDNDYCERRTEEIPVLPNDPDKPCEKDPLKNMQVSNYNRGVSANRFGCVRVGAPTCPEGSKNHKGIDLAAEVGTQVYSMFDGTFVYAGTEVNSSGAVDGWGNYMVMKTNILGSDYFILFAHLREIPNLSGSINAGQMVAYSGESATQGAPHLHVEIRKLPNLRSAFNQSTPVDPEDFFNADLDGNGNNTNINCN